MLYACFRLGRWLVVTLPMRASYRIAVVLADIYYLFARKEKKAIAHNLAVVLGTDDKKIIQKHMRGVFRNFAKYLVDFFRFSIITKDFILRHVKVEGKENIDKALAAGKGAILVTAHLGSWEFGGAIVTSLGYPLYAIALDHKDTRINDFFLAQRAYADVNIIPIGTALRGCFKVLKNNSMLAIVGDRDFSNYGITEKFFGRYTTLPKGPAFFSLRTGAPIIPTFCLRTKDDGIKLVFEKPLEIQATKNITDDDVRKAIRSYLPAMERYIKALPDQWYAFRKVWD